MSDPQECLLARWVFILGSFLAGVALGVALAGAVLLWGLP